MIKAIVADDEKELRAYLKKLLSQVWPELEFVGEASNGPDALELIDIHAPQIAFLDIKMPGLSGLEVAGKIADSCHIVFVTAYDDYAVEAFEREAVDYLVKPVTKKRLLHTVGRLKKRLQTSVTPPSGISDIIVQVLTRIQEKPSSGYLQWIKTQHKDSVRLISVNDVDYFQADEKYTLVVTEAGESLIKTGIRDLVGQLDPHKFWQIHRATIVNVSKIEGMSRSITGRGIVKLKNRKETLTVSRQYLHLFKQM